MDILQVMSWLGMFLAKAAGILAIIYLPMIIGLRWQPKIDDKGLFTAPLSWVLAISTGLILGAMLLAFNLDPVYFTVDNIFRPHGPWELSFSEFIRVRVNPFNYSFRPMFQYLDSYDSDMNLSVVLALAATTYGLLSLRAFRLWGSLNALRGIMFGSVVVMWAAYMTIFLLCLFLWLCNLLNFWILALMTVAIHLHRNHALPIVLHTLVAPLNSGGHDTHGGHGHGDHGQGDHGHGGHGDHHGSHGHGGHDNHGHEHGHGHGDSHGEHGEHDGHGSHDVHDRHHGHTDHGRDGHGHDDHGGQDSHHGHDDHGHGHGGQHASSHGDSHGHGGHEAAGKDSSHENASFAGGRRPPRAPYTLYRHR
jgi:hypothetical protein